MVDACAEVCHAQQVKMLATSALTAARQVVDASATQLEQAGTYSALHPHLFHQGLRHIGDDDVLLDMHNLLCC